MSVRPFLISLTATVVFTGLVFVSAGRVTVWQAWIYAGISLCLNIGQRLVLSGHPELAKERARVPENGQSWDKVLLGVGLLLTLAMLVTVGLQYRYWGGPSMAIVWFILGVLLQLAGMLLFLWALRENRFFSAVVRIQADGGHAVCTTGPYRIIRHPGNMGMIIGTLGFPLLFQSTWSFVPAALFVVVLIVRTHLEDVTLTKELDGYDEYSRKTRYRLIPGLW